MNFFKDRPLTEQKKAWNREEVNKIDCLIRNNSPLIELVLFHVGIDTMLRVSDLLGLRVCDVVTNNGIVKDEYLIKQIKTGEAVEVVLQPPTREAIKKYLRKLRTEGNHYLFPSPRNPEMHLSAWWLRQKVKQWTHTIGLPIEQYSCHSLRRTGAMHLYLQSGRDLEVVRRALGHTSIETTKYYLGVDRQHVKEILRQHPIWDVRVS